MTEPGRRLAEGRASEIFEFGAGRVLRRAKGNCSMDAEARVMQHVLACGFPAPAVHEVRAGGREIVMDRIEGPTMMQLLERRPWTLRRQAATLATLHRRLHEIPAPPWLAPFPGGASGGARVLHLDLHPLNVVCSPAGPVLLDWTNAAAGDPLADVAMTWALVGSGEIPAPRPVAGVLGAFRRVFLESFLRHFDRAAVAACLGAVVAHKASDPNMKPAEVEAMRRLAAREDRRAG